ncbi:MAG: protein-export chaperone SecB [Candidatus Puniceispirillum sp.]|jgi:preprotein translocase subunit SecB
MAKASAKSKTSTTSKNTDGGVSETAAPTPRQLVVHTQYVKDLSFENPNAPKVLIESQGQPDVEITVNVGAQLVSEGQYEVTLNLAAKAHSGETALFLVDLTFAGLMTPEGAAPDEINPLIMIEGPRLLFPFARAIISDATRDGGFMPLNIQPIDFVAVYQHNLAQQAAAAESKQ